MLRACWLLLAACNFSTTTGDDSGFEPRTLTDDDLAGTVRDGVLTAGNVEPDGFVLGGLHARAYQAALVDTGEDFAKVLADADASTQFGAGHGQVPINWGNNARPKGLGLISDSNFSVLYDGEILLPKGEVTLDVDVDDHGLVELFGKTVVDAGKATFVVPEIGWYPIRAAMTQLNGPARLALTIEQDQVKTPVDGNYLRARVTADRGLVVFVFDGQGFVGPHGQVTRPTINEAFGGLAPPYDLTTSFDRFSLRFAGQLRIDTAGSYMFGAILGTDDGWRLWIDGNPIAHHWLGHPDVGVGTVDLTPGWHSILVDYADEIGIAQIAVTMAGPDAPAGGTIAPERLRPVVVFGNTFSFSTPLSTPIMDATSTFVMMPLPGEPTELIDAVDYAFRIDNQDMSTIAVTLFDCTAGQTLPVNTIPSYHHYPADKACAGKVTNPVVDWQFRISDSTVGNAGFAGLGGIRDYGVAALYHGGPKMPFAPVITYTSDARPTPGAKRIEAARAIGALDGATVEIAVRSAADAAGLDAAEYAIVRDGERIDTAGEVMQYRVTISTNGWISPVLDKVEIDYDVAE